MIFPLLGVLVYLFASLIFYVYFIPFRWEGLSADGANLLGEAWINENTAVPFANQMIEEANDIFGQSDDLWFTYSNSTTDMDGYMIQTRHITEGPFNESGVLLTRSKVILSGSAKAKEVYEFLVSPKGFEVIDPMSDPKDFSEYIERFPKFKRKNQGRLEVAHAFASPATQFCVLNAFWDAKRIFVSKSISHKSCPGTSIYGDNPDEVKMPRAVTTFALRTTDVSTKKNGKKVVVLEMINFVYLHMPIPLNFVNVAFFFQGLITRLEESMPTAFHTTQDLKKIKDKTEM